MRIHAPGPCFCAIVAPRGAESGIFIVQPMDTFVIFHLTADLIYKSHPYIFFEPQHTCFMIFIMCSVDENVSFNLIVIFFSVQHLKIM